MLMVSRLNRFFVGFYGTFVEIIATKMGHDRMGKFSSSLFNKSSVLICQKRV